MRARGYRSFTMVVGIDRFGATGGNPSGRRPNFFGRQHLTFDKGGKFSTGREVGVTIPPVVARIFFGRQHLTFDKGRAWMPEVERPKFR